MFHLFLQKEPLSIHPPQEGNRLESEWDTCMWVWNWSIRSWGHIRFQFTNVQRLWDGVISHTSALSCGQLALVLFAESREVAALLSGVPTHLKLPSKPTKPVNKNTGKYFFFSSWEHQCQADVRRPVQRRKHNRKQRMSGCKTTSPPLQLAWTEPCKQGRHTSP